MNWRGREVSRRGWGWCLNEEGLIDSIALIGKDPSLREYHHIADVSMKFAFAHGDYRFNCLVRIIGMRVSNVSIEWKLTCESHEIDLQSKMTLTLFNYAGSGINSAHNNLITIAGRFRDFVTMILISSPLLLNNGRRHQSTITWHAVLFCANWRILFRLNVFVRVI